MCSSDLVLVRMRVSMWMKEGGYVILVWRDEGKYVLVRMRVSMWMKEGGYVRSSTIV